MDGGGGGGSSGSQTQQQISQPIIPSYLQNLIGQSAQSWQQLGQQAQPMLSQLLTQQAPQYQTWSGQEQDLASMLYNLAGTTAGAGANAPALNLGALSDISPLSIPGQNVYSSDPFNQAALQQLSALTGGPIGSSAATQAGMQAFRDVTAPQVMSGYSAAAGGGGVGGGLPEAMALASSQAALPLIQQEIANRQAAAQQYAQMGGANVAAQFQIPGLELSQQQAQSQIEQARNQQLIQAFQAQQSGNLAQQQQQIANIQAALEAQGIPRDIANQQAQANYNDLLRVLQNIQTGALGPLQQFGGQTIGQQSFGLGMSGAQQSPNLWNLLI